MLRFFRQASPFTLLALIIVSLVARVSAVAHATVPLPAPFSPLYNNLLQLLQPAPGKGSGFLWMLLAVCMTVGQAVYFNGIISRHKLAPKAGYTPAFVYTVLSALHPAFSAFSAPLLCCWCILGMLDIFMGLHQPQSPRKHIFNAGLLAATASLLFYPAAVLCLWFFLALLLLRAFHASEWAVGLMGLLTPVYFLSAILFLGGAPGLLHLTDYSRPEPLNISARLLYCTGTVSGIVLLLIAGLVFTRQQHIGSSVILRRNRIVILGMLPVMAVTAAFGMLYAGAASLLLALPFVAVPAMAPITGDNTNRYSNFVWWLFIALLLFAQITFYR